MIRKILLTAAAGLALPAAASAATYDAFASFDGTQGAGGFRYFSLANGSASPLTSSTSCVVPVPVCLQGGGDLPGAYKSATVFKNLTYTVPNDRLLIHPGSNSAIGIFFIAPTAGTYDFTASFNVVDDRPSGAAIFKLTNVTGTVVATPLGGIGPVVSSATHSGSIFLNAGQFLAFGLNNAGNYSNDSTGFNFVLTNAVPEPASWALMIAGFGLAGAAARRRRPNICLA